MEDNLSSPFVFQTMFKCKNRLLDLNASFLILMTGIKNTIGVRALDFAQCYYFLERRNFGGELSEQFPLGGLFLQVR